jgi:hypothetical protein
MAWIPAEVVFTSDSLVIGDPRAPCIIDIGILRRTLKVACKIPHIIVMNFAQDDIRDVIIQHVQHSPLVRTFEWHSISSDIANVLHNPALEQLMLGNCTETEAANILRLAAPHLSLKRLSISLVMYENSDSTQVVGRVIDLVLMNRTLVDYEFHIPVMDSNSRLSELRSALVNNWTILHMRLNVISPRRERLSGDAALLQTTVKDMVLRNRAMQWIISRESALDACLGLAPLRLSTYAVLEILGWVPPFHHRFRWHGIDDFDPLRQKKVRLIDGVNRAYEARH